MEPHSHFLLSRNGSRRLPQTLVLLLKTCLAGPSDHPDPVPHTDLSFSQSIRRSVVNVFWLLIPFDRRGDSPFLTLVGMVKLTALCGIGSALWLWSKPNRKGKRPASLDGSTSATETSDVGKSYRTSPCVGNVTCPTARPAHRHVHYATINTPALHYYYTFDYYWLILFRHC